MPGALVVSLSKTDTVRRFHTPCCLYVLPVANAYQKRCKFSRLVWLRWLPMTTVSRCRLDNLISLYLRVLFKTRGEPRWWPWSDALKCQSTLLGLVHSSRFLIGCGFNHRVVLVWVHAAQSSFHVIYCLYVEALWQVLYKLALLDCYKANLCVAFLITFWRHLTSSLQNLGGVSQIRWWRAAFLGAAWTWGATSLEAAAH